MLLRYIFAQWTRSQDWVLEGLIVPRGGGDHSSRSATFAARERERNVVELCLRGATFEQIGRQLNIDRSTAYKAWQRALKRLPAADVEALRKAQSERLQRMRGKLWTEIAGRADPNNPSNVIAPSPELLNDLIGTALRLEAREARLFGLDAPTKQQIAAPPVTFAQPMSDEEADRQWARLTPEEQEQFMMLLQKMQGRWIEPRPTETIEVSVERLP